MNWRLTLLVVTGTLWLPYAAVVWWRLRRDKDLRQADMADARSWIRCPPGPWVLVVRPLESVLLATLPAQWELTCAVNGVLWPVEMLTRRWRSS